MLGTLREQKNTHTITRTYLHELRHAVETQSMHRPGHVSCDCVHVLGNSARVLAERSPGQADSPIANVESRYLQGELDSFGSVISQTRGAYLLPLYEIGPMG